MGYLHHLHGQLRIARQLSSVGLAQGWPLYHITLREMCSLLLHSFEHGGFPAFLALAGRAQSYPWGAEPSQAGVGARSSY